MQLVHEAAGLAVPLARLRPAEQIAVQIDFVELAVPVAAEQELVRRRRRADAPRRADVGDDPDRIQIRVEDLNATVAAIGRASF